MPGSQNEQKENMFIISRISSNKQMYTDLPKPPSVKFLLKITSSFLSVYHLEKKKKVNMQKNTNQSFPVNS